MKRSASSEGGAERGGGGALQNKLVFRPLGSGREVGRSCHILEFMGKRIMLDCGIHPGRRGQDALPFFGSIDGPIDLVLVTYVVPTHVPALFISLFDCFVLLYAVTSLQSSWMQDIACHHHAPSELIIILAPPFALYTSDGLTSHLLQPSG
jgi:hypothetical protein